MRTAFRKGLRRIFAVAGLAISIPIITMAEDFFVSQTPQGSADGSSALNSAGISFFNTPANWNSPVKVPGKIGPGDTVRLVGVLTTPLTVQASGTPGSPITIRFEPNAIMTSPAWPQSGAITINTRHYITIDGGTNGIIENTANGTSLANQIDSYGVRAQNSSHLTVQNLTVRNLYVRVVGTDNRAFGKAISNTSSSTTFTNFTVRNCTIHDAFVGIDADYGPGATDYEFSNNTVYNCNWGGRTGDRNSASSLSGLRVHNNNFHSWTKWDGTDAASQGALHHNGFFGWAVSGGSLSNIDVHSNIIGPNYSNVTPNGSTSGVFFSGNVSHLRIYNNLFLANSNDAPANGFITVGVNNGHTGFHFFNNTFVGGGIGNAIAAGAGNGTYTIRNNLAMNCTFILFNSSANSTLVSNNNLGFNLRLGQEFSFSPNSSSVFRTFQQWQALGFDSNSIIANPLLDSQYVPTAASPAVDSGANTPSTFTTKDARGIDRPSGVAWDIGAYEYLQTNPLIITQPPGNVFSAVGGTVNLSVTARGQAPLSYQWSKDGIPLTNDSKISGATTRSLSIANAAPSDAGSYTVQISNTIGPLVSSSPAVLTIGAGVSPSFSTQPIATQSVSLGATASFSIVATGNPIPSIQWRKNGANIVNGGRISGATSSTLTITNVEAVDAGTYAAFADNMIPPAATSNGSVLVVTGAPPSISSQPVGATVLAGAPVTLSVSATGTAPLSYQWSKAGTAISGATASSYFLPAAQGGDTGDYSVTVTNAFGSVTSTTAFLGVIVTPPPTFTSQPQSATVISGQSVNVRASATGATSYAWQVSSDGGATWSALSNDETFSGVSTDTLSVKNATAGLATLRFRVIVSNEGGAALSSALSFAVVPPVLVSPVDVGVTSAGSLLVSDPGIEVIHAISPTGVASILAGVRNLPGAIDGSGSNALFRQPAGIVLDSAGNVYLADAGNALIRKVASGGQVTTIAGSEVNKGHRDGTGSSAWFNSPSGITSDGSGNLYVADTGNSVIRKITAAGLVTTLAGAAESRGSSDGVGAAARFNEPVGIAVDATGNIYVADRLNQTIRRITPNGTVTTVAGLAGVAGYTDGNALTQALFNRPTGLAVDSSGNLFITDTGNSTIRKVTASGIVSTLAGVPTISGFKDGTGTAAWFNQPTGLRLGSGGALYVADTGNAAIRWVSSTGAVVTIALTSAASEFPSVPTNLPVASDSPMIPDAPSLPTTTTTLLQAPELPSVSPTIPQPPSLPASTPATPPVPGGGASGGGGGGALSPWFIIALLAICAVRYRASIRNWWIDCGREHTS
jgi:hypothetical protein